MDYKVKTELELPTELFDVRYHSRRSELLCVATIAGDILLYEDGKLSSQLEKHHKGSSVRRVRFDKDGRMVTIARTVKIHDLQTNQTVHTLKRGDGIKSSFYSLFLLGENLITAGDDDGKLFVWDTRSPNQTVLTASNCEQYISDIDGRYEGRKIVCTSGEGTLTAYDLRANKMIDPQSELFEAGFQCVKLVDVNKKVVIGGEDGAVYVFNQNEWAHTSGKFAVGDDSQNRGKCSIEGIDCLPDNSTFVIVCSDGRMRSMTLWPHQLLSETVLCKRNSLETMHVNPHPGKSEILVGGDKYVNIVTYEEKSDDEGQESNVSHSSSSSADKSDTEEEGEGGDNEESRAKRSKELANTKKLKVDTQDYLNIF